MIQIELLEDVPEFYPPIELDGAVYSFKFRFDYFDGSWFFSIGEVLSNIKIVNGVDLLENYHYLDVPPGKLIAQRLKGSSSKPTADNFGKNKEITLTYTSIYE